MPVGCDTDGDAESLRVDPACPSLQLARTNINDTTVACPAAWLQILAMVKFVDPTMARSTKHAPIASALRHERASATMPGMGIEFTLRDADGRQMTRLSDPNGGTFDAAGDFDVLLGSPDLPVLGAIDPYGDATLNAKQMSALIADIDAALGRAKPGPEARGLRRLRTLAELCQADESLLLQVIGD